MSAGGIGGVGGRREKTTALADECDSRCGACAATLTDEELEGGTGGTGSLSAHTGGPISSHSRASLCTRFAICLAQKSTPRRSRNPSRRRVLGSAAPYGTPRIGAVVDQLALPNRVAPRVDQCETCRHHRSEVVGGLISHPPARPWAGSRHTRRGAPALASGLGMAVRPASSPDGFSAQHCRAGCSAEILALARWGGGPLE
jgi:hypothetical protein